MDQTPTKPQWNERFPSPPSGWTRTPYRGAGHRGAVSGRGYSPYSPNSSTYSPGFNRGHWGGSPRSGYGGSPGMFGSGGRNFGEKQRRGNGFGRPVQRESFHSIEKYFSPAMLEDPWAALQPKVTEPSTNNNP